MGKVKKYRPLTELTLDLTKAEGFEPKFTTDGKTYSLILEDTTDAVSLRLLDKPDRRHPEE